MYSFRVWYVHCLAETSFEFDWIHPIESLAVIRFSCSVKFCKQLDNNDTGRSLQNALAFVLKLFSGKSSFRSRKYSKLNVCIDNFTVIQFLWCEKMIKFTPKRVVDSYLQKQWNISKVPSQSTSHTHRSSGRAEAVGLPWSQRLSFILYNDILRRKPLLIFLLSAWIGESAELSPLHADNKNNKSGLRRKISL